MINLEDKLLGLEDKPGYPKEQISRPQKRNPGFSNTNYNILSNKALAEHHYLPEDLRPRATPEPEQVYKISAVEYRDFDIISNRYHQDHDTKAKMNQEMYK